jgi:serine/threonine-protein kinase
LLAACGGGAAPSGWSSATVANQIVYFGGDNAKAYALDANVGTLKWEFAGEKDHLLGSIYGQPAVDNGTVYLTAYIGATATDGQLFALDAANGNLKWKFPPASTLGASIVSSPVVKDGVIYFGANDHKLYAVDAASGQPKWQFATNDKIWGDAQIADGVVYFGSLDHKLYALDAATGTKKWDFDGGGIIVTKPLVANGTVYFGALEKLFALDAATGAPKWSQPVSLGVGNWIWSSPTLQNNVLYFGTLGGQVYAYDATTGNAVWSQPFVTNSSVRSSVVISGTTGYFGTEDHKVYALNLQNGQSVWGVLLNGAVLATPTVEGDSVYVGAHGHSFYALNAANGAVKWSFDLAKDQPGVQQ